MNVYFWYSLSPIIYEFAQLFLLNSNICLVFNFDDAEIWVVMIFVNYLSFEAIWYDNVSLEMIINYDIAFVLVIYKEVTATLPKHLIMIIF